MALFFCCSKLITLFRKHSGKLTLQVLTIMTANASLLPPQRIRRGEKNSNGKRAKSVQSTLPVAAFRTNNLIVIDAILSN
jgi:hypothetical protein